MIHVDLYISPETHTHKFIIYNVHTQGWYGFVRPTTQKDGCQCVNPSKTARVSLSPCTFQLFRGQYLAEIGGRPMAGQWPDGISQLWRPFQTRERCLASLGVGSYNHLPSFPRDVPKYVPNSLRPSEFFSHTWDPWSLWESPSPCPLGPGMAEEEASWDQSLEEWLITEAPAIAQGLQEIDPDLIRLW